MDTARGNGYPIALRVERIPRRHTGIVHVTTGVVTPPSVALSLCQAASTLAVGSNTGTLQVNCSHANFAAELANLHVRHYPALRQQIDTESV